MLYRENTSKVVLCVVTTGLLIYLMRAASNSCEIVY
jgi:hypothetical protein